MNAVLLCFVFVSAAIVWYLAAGHSARRLLDESGQLSRGIPRVSVGDRLLMVLIGLPVTAFVIGAVTALSWFWLRAPPEDTLPWLAAAALSLMALTAIKTRRSQRFRAAHAVGPAERTAPPYSGAVLTAAVLCLVFVFPVLLASLWMGSGAFPPVFFNVDAPYYLSQVHALARSQTYPPPSLNTLGVTLSYHYGLQLVASLLPRFGMLPAHKALFWVMVPVFVTGTVAVVWRLALAADRRGVPMWIAVLALCFLIEYPLAVLHDSMPPEPLSDLGKALSRLGETALQFERFGSGYPIISNLVGAFVVLVIGFAMTDRSMPFRLSTIAIACGTLPLFKSAFIVPVGLWLGAWSIFVLVRERYFGPIVSAGAAFGIALLLSGMSVHAHYQFSLSLSPFSHGREWRADILEQGLLSYGSFWLTTLLLLLILRSGHSRPEGARKFTGMAILLSGLVVLLLPVFVVVTYIDAGGKLVELSEAKQWFRPLRWIAPIALVAAMAAHWPFLRHWRRTFVTTVVALLAAVPLVVKINDAAVLLTTPSKWHDFADNRLIAPALAAIPVNGSLVAVNDHHYPADNYARARRQFQIAALFGHQAYGAAVLYDPPQDADERVRAQEMLARAEWSPDLAAIACQAGWTHALLSSRTGFPRVVPGTLVYDAPDFRVYRLPACDTPARLAN